jgi:hypothetical protein
MNNQGSPDQQKATGLFRATMLFVTALLFTALASATFAQSPDVRKAFRFYDIEQPSKMIPALE